MARLLNKHSSIGMLHSYNLFLKSNSLYIVRSDIIDLIISAEEFIFRSDHRGRVYTEIYG